MKIIKTLYIHDRIIYEKGKSVDGSDTSKWLSPTREIKYGNPIEVSKWK
jgi:hypothetical protein